jgi:hypothetical protein
MRLPTRDAKGAILEDLVSYLFEQVPGVGTSHRNVLNAFGTEEVDVAFFNARSADGLFFIDENSFLVECKNWSKPVDGQEIVYLAHRLLTRNLRHGILVAASGITGTPGHLQQARYEIGVALSVLHVRILVIDRLETMALTDGADLVKLLLDKRLDLDATGTCF